MKLPRFGALARDTAQVGFWQAARLGSQALWVLVIARLLGAQGYGAFVGVAGLATTLGGLTGLGLGLLLLQDVAREPALFGDRWRQGWQVSLLSGLVLCLLFLPLAWALFGSRISLSTLLTIGLSELLFYPLVSIAAFAFSAHHRMGVAAALPALVAAARVLVALLCMLALKRPTLDGYAMFHLAASALCAAGSCWAVKRQLRPAPARLRLGRREVGEGLGFSMVWMVGNALTTLDKTVVLRLAGAQIAGGYGAAYRLASLLAMPVDALTMAAGPRLFRHGGGQQPQPGLIRRLFCIALAYALLAALVLALLAGTLPWLLGPSFADAVPAARAMAWLVPCYSLRLLGSNVLMSGDRKRWRVAIESLGLCLLLALGWAWIPDQGMLGAVRMICVTEGVLAALTWLVVAASGRPGHPGRAGRTPAVPSTNLDERGPVAHRLAPGPSPRI